MTTTTTTETTTTPRTLHTLRFGVEIETVGATRASLAHAIHTVVGGTCAGDSVTDARGRSWKVVRDASLIGDASGEVVTPILEYGDLDELQRVVRALRETAHASVNESCGIHVHVGAERFETKHLRNLALLMNQQEDLLIPALRIQHRRLERYTRRIEQGTLERLTSAGSIEAAQQAWYGTRRPEHDARDRYNHTRYHGLNLHSFFYRKTVEFRYFEGTLHAGKVKTYVQFCLSVMAKALDARSVSKVKRTHSEASAKYDFRVFLLRLGMIGPEFATARKHLLANLTGSAAWKNGRPANDVGTTAAQEVA